MPDDDPGWRDAVRFHLKATIFLAVLVLLAISLGSYAIYKHYEPVYVTDGSHVFNNNLRAVETKIRHENDWVAASGRPFVSVAVLGTMSPQPDREPLDDTRTRHGIEGAFLAQYEANHPSGPSGRPGAPLIRLLLADEGSQLRTWRQATAALEDEISSNDHLVAVTGLGISVAGTGQVIRELSSRRHTIGMVGAVLTGNEFSDLPGLVRIAPTNTDEASAAATFLDTDPNPANPLPPHTKIWLVQDQNRADNYARSLATAFPTALTGHPRHWQYQLAPPGTAYDSSLPDATAVLQGIGDPVCHAGAQVVYFAGRGVDLQAFLTGLAHRYCAATQPLTVLTGSDASQLVDHGTLWPDGANMTVYYTSLAHPQVWTHQPPVVDHATTAWFDKPRYGFRSVFSGEALDDGWAIMFHDAVLTAVTAIDKLYTQTGAIPSAGGIAQELNQVTVHGASGYICFNIHHDPINKAIPIVRLDQHGRLGYITLTSATGDTPTSDHCD